MDAVKVLDRMAGDSPELKRLTDEARINATVAQLIYSARQERSQAFRKQNWLNELGQGKP